MNSWGWITPEGKVIELRDGETHLQSSKRFIKELGLKEESIDAHYSYSVDFLLSKRWIRVANWFSYEGASPDKISYEAKKAISDLVWRCAAKAPPGTWFMYDVFEGAEANIYSALAKEFVTKLIHGGKQNKSKLAQFREWYEHTQEKCDESATSYAWLSPEGKMIEVPAGKTHPQYADEILVGLLGKEEARMVASPFFWLMSRGWVRVSNAYMYEGPHIRELNPAQKQAIAELVKGCPPIKHPNLYTYEIGVGKERGALGGVNPKQFISAIYSNQMRQRSKAMMFREHILRMVLERVKEMKKKK